MNTLKHGILASIIAFSTYANVSAAAESSTKVSANVVLTSDYAFRGFSQTEGDPAIQGGFDISYDNGIYAGVWASNVESDPSAPVNYSGANLETDIYLGWSKDFNNLSVDLGALRYQYHGTDTDANNTDEYHVGTGYDFQVVSAGLTLHYSPDYFGAEKAIYWDFSGELPLPKGFTLTAHYGMTDYRNDALGDDYKDWSLGIGTELGGFGLSLAYVDTSGVAAGCTRDTCDGRTILSLSKSL